MFSSDSLSPGLSYFRKLLVMQPGIINAGIQLESYQQCKGIKIKPEHNGNKCSYGAEELI